MFYISHIQWHPEDATYKCIACGASVQPGAEFITGFGARFRAEHEACEASLAPEQRAEFASKVMDLRNAGTIR